jgi:cell division protein FtsW (lipid II flippase)
VTHDANARKLRESAVKPLDPPMTPLAIGGMVVWAVAGVVLWLAGAPTTWVWTCVAGAALGFPGWAVMRRHDRHRAARLAAEANRS